jgi:NAD dependent epimerase/dehydratase
MFWSGKKVLVTGAGGFIGSHLCEALLKSGAEVTAMIRYNSRSDWGNLEFIPAPYKSILKVAPGNVEDPFLVDGLVKGQEVIFHLAALIGIPYSYQAPSSYIRTNVEGTMNVLEAARRHGVERVIQTSTSETYGTALYTPIDEKHPLQGQSPYSASKIGADKLAESYFLSFAVPVATIRPFNTFGPRQSARAVIPTIISQALTQPEICLGSLDPVRDLSYVKDTVDAFLKTGESKRAVGETINIGSGWGITVGDLADKILKLMGVNKPVVQEDQRFRPAKSEVYRLICDNRKALENLNWAPKTPLEIALEETILFIREHIQIYKPAQYVR